MSIILRTQYALEESMDSSSFTRSPEFPLTKPPTEAKSLGSGTGTVFPELGVRKVINWVISVIADFGFRSAGEVRGICTSGALLWRGSSLH